MSSSHRGVYGSQGGVIPRGFASMDPERQREVAGPDGRKSQEQAFVWEQARPAVQQSDKTGSWRAEPAPGEGGSARRG